jgi:hypothetical protein
MTTRVRFILPVLSATLVAIVGLGNQVLYIIYALAFMFFLFGMFKYFFSSGANAEKNRSEGKQFMLWGFIGMVVLFGVWGIVKILLGVLQSWA